MNCIECNQPLPADAAPNVIRHKECCGRVEADPKPGAWRCHICGHTWKPEVMHLSTKYNYFFSHCPMCSAKVEEPKKRFSISVEVLSWLAMVSCLSIGPAFVFAPNQRWLIILLFVILLFSIIGFIVKGIRVRSES